MVLSLIAILLLGSISVGNCLCNGRMEMNITSGNGEITSPNYRDEYGRTANCSWNFNPSEGYALVLTIKYQRLYILGDSKKICFGSYSFTINGDTQECTNYVDTKYPDSLIEPFEFFDSMCGGDAGNKSSVRVQYISDGRTYTGSETVISTASMGLRIEYKWSECPTTAVTTTEYVATNVFGDTSHHQQETTEPDNNYTLTTTKVGSHLSVDAKSTTETPIETTTNPDIMGQTTKSIPIETGSTENYFTSHSTTNTAGETAGANSDGISDTTKLVLVSIPGFIGIMILVATAIVFCRKRGDKSQDGNKVGQENVGSDQMENVESPIQEPEQDNAAGDGSSTSVDREMENAKNTCQVAEQNEPTTSAIQEEESPYTIMYSALARKDQEDEKKTPSIEEDEHKYDMYSAVVRKTEGGDKV
ncbi:uncharacterized protein LOC120331968 isoform X1 [Styela clava]